jgi:hypothetical protein
VLADLDAPDRLPATLSTACWAIFTAAALAALAELAELAELALEPVKFALQPATAVRA